MTLRKEFDEVQKLIVKFSRGEFSGLPSASQDAEVLGAFIENLVMLGEELSETTVSKEYFQDIFNSVPDVIIIMDAKGRIITGNRAAGEFSEKFRSPENGTAYFNDVYCMPSAKDAFGNLKKSYINCRHEAGIKLKIKTDAYPTFLCRFGSMISAGKTKRYIALIKNITEAEEYQAKISDAAIKYRQLFVNSSDGIFRADKEGNILEANGAMRVLLKIQKEKALFPPLRDFVILPHTSPAAFIKQMNLALNLENVEFKIKAADGVLRDCLFSCAPVYENKILTGFQGIIKNISEYKEYNRLLMRSLGESQEKERKRIATDLHDSIGQQLSGIKFMLGTLMSVCKEDEHKGVLRQMNADVFNIVEELRKICFDLMPGALEKFGLVRTVDEFLSKNKRVWPGVGFHFRHSGAFPRLRVEMETGIYRIIQEFVNNSLKYSGCNKITISLTLKNKNWVELDLKDNGKGFDLRSKTGKGMGLNNISSRVVAFNGTIKFSSAVNKGTHFLIKIPTIKP